MFAYCLNNPVNASDPTGDAATWLVSGLIGAVTNASCAYMLGARGNDLMVAAFEGFVGSLPIIGTVLAVISAVEISVKCSNVTDSVFLGFLAGGMSLATSFFSGANISKLQGVNQMDEAAELLFDAFFGYGANIFYTAAWMDVISYSETPTETETKNLTTNTGVQSSFATNYRGGSTLRCNFAALR